MPVTDSGHRSRTAALSTGTARCRSVRLGRCSPYDATIGAWNGPVRGAARPRPNCGQALEAKALSPGGSVRTHRSYWWVRWPGPRRPRRRLAAAGDRRGRRRPHVRAGGPARHRQVADDHQPAHAGRSPRARRCCSSPRSGRPSTSSRAGWTPSAWACSPSTCTTRARAPRWCGRRSGWRWSTRSPSTSRAWPRDAEDLALGPPDARPLRRPAARRERRRPVAVLGAHGRADRRHRGRPAAGAAAVRGQRPGRGAHRRCGRALALLPDIADLTRPSLRHPWAFVDYPDIDLPATQAAAAEVDAAVRGLTGVRRAVRRAAPRRGRRPTSTRWRTCCPARRSVSTCSTRRSPSSGRRRRRRCWARSPRSPRSATRASTSRRRRRCALPLAEIYVAGADRGGVVVVRPPAAADRRPRPARAVPAARGDGEAEGRAGAGREPVAGADRGRRRSRRGPSSHPGPDACPRAGTRSATPTCSTGRSRGCAGPVPPSTASTPFHVALRKLIVAGLPAGPGGARRGRPPAGRRRRDAGRLPEQPRRSCRPGPATTASCCAGR